MCAVSHDLPHAPQSSGALFRSISHPFSDLWSQSAHPSAHEVEQAPATQIAAPWVTDGQGSHADAAQPKSG